MMIIVEFVRVCFGIVDAVSWVVLQLFKFLINTMFTCIGWAGGKISELPENIAIPVVFLLGLILIAAVVSIFYFAPHLLFFFVVVLPVSFILLRFLLGWVLIFGICYFLYHKVKKGVQRVSKTVKGGEVVE